MISKFAMILITYRGSHGMESQNQRMCWTGRDPQGPSSPIHMKTPTITPRACRPNIPQNQLQQEVSDLGGATFWDVPSQWDVLLWILMDYSHVFIPAKHLGHRCSKSTVNWVQLPYLPQLVMAPGRAHCHSMAYKLCTQTVCSKDLVHLKKPLKYPKG